MSNNHPDFSQIDLDFSQAETNLDGGKPQAKLLARKPMGA